MNIKNVAIITGGVVLVAAGAYGIYRLFIKSDTTEKIVPDLETVIAAMPESRLNTAGEPPTPYVVAQPFDASAHTHAENGASESNQSPIQIMLKQQHEQINGALNILKNDTISVIRGLNDVSDVLENIMIQTEKIITDSISDDLDSDSELSKLVLPDRKTRSQLLQQLIAADTLRNDAYNKLQEKGNRNVFEAINHTKQCLFDSIVMLEGILTEIAKIDLIQQGNIKSINDDKPTSDEEIADHIEADQ